MIPPPPRSTLFSLHDALPILGLTKVEGRVRGRFMVPMHAKSERGLPMNRVGRDSRRALIFCRWAIRARRSLPPPFTVPMHGRGERGLPVNLLRSAHATGWRRLKAEL